MFTFEHSIDSTASPEAIWQLYANVSEWLRWDRGLADVELDGAFIQGATGRITPTGMDMLPFTLTWVEASRGFADETPAMGHVLRFHHLLEPLAGGGTRITHRVEVEGPAAEDMGPNVVSDTPEAMAALAALAERAPTETLRQPSATGMIDR